MAMLNFYLATGLGAFLVLFILMPASKKQHFMFMDAFLMFAGLGAFLYGVLNLTSHLPK